MKDSQKLLPPRQRNKRLVRFAAISAVIVAIAGITTVVLSQDKNSASKGSLRQEPSQEKKYMATKEIIFDQATGKLRKPTAEETQAMVAQISELTNRSTEGLTVKTETNGKKMVNLEGRFNGVVLGRANADGTTEVRCVFTLGEAAEFLGLEEVNSKGEPPCEKTFLKQRTRSFFSP